jgi:hypothetical protein
MNSKIFLLGLVMLLTSCKDSIKVTTDDFCAAVDTVTGIMVHDIYSGCQ